MFVSHSPYFQSFLASTLLSQDFFVRSFKSIEIILKMFSWFIKSAFDGIFDLIGLEFTNSIFLFTSVLESFCTFKCFIFITRSNVTWEQIFKSTERLNTNLSVWLTALHFRIGYLRLRLMWSLWCRISPKYPNRPFGHLFEVGLKSYWCNTTMLG